MMFQSPDGDSVVSHYGYYIDGIGYLGFVSVP